MYRTVFVLLVIASSLACVVLPVIGANNFFDEFRQSYSSSAHFRLLASQWIGPIFALSFLLVMMALRVFGKRFFWWIWLFGLLGPIYTSLAVGGLSHDFSHTVFHECSGIYGIWIHGLNLIGGVSFVALAVLAFYEIVSLGDF